jgi:hypothetical protein
MDPVIPVPEWKKRKNDDGGTSGRFLYRTEMADA